MKIAYLGAGLMALVAAPLIAQPGPPPGEMHGPMMKPITKADAQAMVARHFAELDLNHDGKVTQEEVKAFRGMRFEERMKAHRDREFAKLDSNHDGSISKAEFDVPHLGGPGGPGAPMGEHGGPEGPGGPEHHGPGREHGPMGGGMMMLGMHGFDKADANHDGAVTLAEAQTAAATFFDRLDTNHDGIVSPDEMHAAFGGRGPGGWHHGPEGDMPPPPAK